MRPVVLTLFAWLLAVGSSGAQWSADTRLTADPALSRTEIDGGRNVVVSGEVLMVVWSDNRDGNPEIYAQERLAGTWGTALRLTNHSASSTHAAIGGSEGESRVVWEDDRTGHPEIWMKQKISGQWLAATCLTCDEFESARPGLDHTGQHLVWEETKDGNREIYYRRLPVNEPWEAEFRISNDAMESSHASVASPHSLHSPSDPALRVVAWQDDRDGNWEIYARYGTSFSGWGPEERVSSDDASSRFPSAAVEDDAFCGDAVFISQWVAWQDDRDGNDEIYFAEGENGSWNLPSRVTNTALPSRHPSVGKTYVPFSGGLAQGICGRPSLVWEEGASGVSGTILYQDATAGPAIISDAGADPSHASFAAFHERTLPGIVEGALAVVWTDERDGNQEIYFAEGATLVQVTAIPEPASQARPLEIGLAHPNPFRAATTATVRVSKESALSVRIVDAAGRLVRELFSGTIREGATSFVWDGTAQSGTRAAAGTYFLVAEGDEEAAARPLIRVR